MIVICLGGPATGKTLLTGMVAKIAPRDVVVYDVVCPRNIGKDSKMIAMLATHGVVVFVVIESHDLNDIARSILSAHMENWRLSHSAYVVELEFKPYR